MVMWSRDQDPTPEFDYRASDSSRIYADELDSSMSESQVTFAHHFAKSLLK